MFGVSTFVMNRLDVGRFMMLTVNGLMVFSVSRLVMFSVSRLVMFSMSRLVVFSVSRLVVFSVSRLVMNRLDVGSLSLCFSLSLFSGGLCGGGLSSISFSFSLCLSFS